MSRLLCLQLGHDGACKLKSDGDLITSLRPQHQFIAYLLTSLCQLPFMMQWFSQPLGSIFVLYGGIILTSSLGVIVF